jgi:SAM-dependent methyltransferase
MTLPHCKLCEVEDFADPHLAPVIRQVFPHETRRYGPGFPVRAEYRKHWEVGMAVRGLDELGLLRPDAEVLGVGAGNEPTVFHFTNCVRRVFATDLYLGDEWAESANPGMLRHPERYWPSAWNPRRLVAQHMNGLDLRYEDESFDAVFSSSSLEHFGTHDDIRRAAREMYRVLRPGGALSLSTEFRLAGPSPGLPGILMFDEQELRELIVEAAPWEPVGPLDLGASAATRASVQPFDDAAADVRAHLATRGEIIYHELTWSRHPSVLLRHGELVFGSVHLLLRKAA